jgi:hypothetical protein
MERDFRSGRVVLVAKLSEQQLFLNEPFRRTMPALFASLRVAQPDFPIG